MGGRWFAGLLTGLVLGTTVGMLWAPQPGDLTRRRLAQAWRRARDRFRACWQDAAGAGDGERGGAEGSEA